jgi:L-alanine-DL-glutamate epimerase-like enolase superfamily enzyme
MVKEAEEAIAAGYHHLKVKVAVSTLEQDVENVKAIRNAVGDKVQIMVDANAGWNVHQAIRAIQKMEKYDIFMAEQPTPYWDINGLALVRQKVRTPIMPDESASSLANLIRIIKSDAADALFLKCSKAGGLLKSKMWVSIAKGADLPVICGSKVGNGLTAAAEVNFVFSTDWMTRIEQQCGMGVPLIHGKYNCGAEIEDDIVEEVIPIKNGFYYPPKGPGLGVELNEKMISKYLSPGKKLIVCE